MKPDLVFNVALSIPRLAQLCDACLRNSGSTDLDTGQNYEPKDVAKFEYLLVSGQWVHGPAVPRSRFKESGNL